MWNVFCIWVYPMSGHVGVWCALHVYVVCCACGYCVCGYIDVCCVHVCHAHGLYVCRLYVWISGVLCVGMFCVCVYETEYGAGTVA